jgi:integrase
MSPKKNQESPKPLTTDEMLLSIERALNLLVKLKIKETQGDRKIKDMILMLHSWGCRPIEIAEALGKKPDDINPVISRARTSRAKGKAPGRKRG